jgi:hypothetical protein
MAIKAVAIDDKNTEQLIIGLNRDNVNCLLNGEVFTLPHGIPISLTENSDIVLLFVETDEELEKTISPGAPTCLSVRSLLALIPFGQPGCQLTIRPYREPTG